MKVIAEQIYPEKYEVFQHILERDILSPHAGPDPVHSTSAATETVDRLSGDESTPEGIQASFFANAFRKRLQGEFSDLDNLYLLPDQGQQIQMFNFMAQKFPVVRYAQEILNNAYLEDLKGQTEALIWDIGIGNGQQIVRLIDAWRKTGEPLPLRMTVIGLDPSESSLSQAEQALGKVCGTAGIELSFVSLPKTVEALTEEDWLQLDALLAPMAGQWLANASFALHHIQPVSLRDAFFSRLKSNRPARFGMIEPYADFLTDNLQQRFANAWHHYGLSFWAIDQIDAPAENKNLLKSVFFGREILDVIAKDEGRIEQFETGEMWSERLQKAGFQLDLPQGLPASIPGFPAVGVQSFGQYIGFTAKAFPVISILLAR